MKGLHGFVVPQVIIKLIEDLHDETSPLLVEIFQIAFYLLKCATRMCSSTGCVFAERLTG